MSDPKNRRRILLIYKSIQIELFKVVFWSNLLTAFVMLLAGVLFFNTLKKFAADIEEMAYLGEITRVVGMYAWVYAIYVVTGLAIVLSLVFYSWLKASNTIAGPLYNVKRNLENYVATGEFRPIKLREGDKLTELVDVINAAIARAKSESSEPQNK